MPVNLLEPDELTEHIQTAARHVTQAIHHHAALILTRVGHLVRDAYPAAAGLILDTSRWSESRTFGNRSGTVELLAIMDAEDRMLHDTRTDPDGPTGYRTADNQPWTRCVEEINLHLSEALAWSHHPDELNWLDADDWDDPHPEHTSPLAELSLVLLDYNGGF